MNCPTCGSDKFNDQTAMRIHHKLSHGVSIAKESSVCLQCDDKFEYYPSNREGKLCHNCSDRNGESWGDSMAIIKKENGTYRQTSSKMKKNRVEQIKEATGCSQCGYNEHPSALHFHHTGDKIDTISNMAHRAYTWDELKNELRECIILCANCHTVNHMRA